MVNEVIISSQVAELVRAILAASKTLPTPDTSYHGGVGDGCTSLNSYYFGDDRNGVVILCEPVGESQRVCVASYCHYDWDSFRQLSV